MDPGMRDMIIETHTDVKHILNELAEGRKTFNEHDKRIRSVEKQLQRNNGKLIIVSMIIVGLMTVAANILV